MHTVIPRATTEKKVQTDIGREGKKEEGNLNGIIVIFYLTQKKQRRNRGTKRTNDIENKKHSDWCKANSTNNYIKCEQTEYSNQK